MICDGNMDKLEKFGKIDESNIGVILEDIGEFLQLYLFKGNVSLNSTEIENLFELSHDDLNILKAVHFLISDEVRNLVGILPRLVRNLAHSTQRKTTIMKGNVRGSINWNMTVKERYSGGFDDKSLFVCNQPSKYYDLEENQVLKFLLNKIKYLKQTYLNFISPETFDFEKINQNTDWYTVINDTYEITKLILKKVYFRDISELKIKSKHIRKCIKNRNLHYHYVAKAYMLYEDLFVNDNREALIKLINERVIKTANPNKLYEIYVFYNLVKSLPGVHEKKLLYSGNNYSTTSLLDGLEITVHYQKTPDSLKEVSQYLEIIKNYEISGKTRSPDIIIEFKKDNETYYRLVEVKNSSSPNYIRESLYKVMGYYKDFKGVCELENFNLTEKYSVVLVVWGSISIKKDYNPFDDDIIILNRKEFISNLKNLLTLKI